LCFASELVALARNGEHVPIEGSSAGREAIQVSRRPVPEGIEIEEKRELFKDIYGVWSHARSLSVPAGSSDLYA
jgi:hypothetical protein